PPVRDDFRRYIVNGSGRMNRRPKIPRARKVMGVCVKTSSEGQVTVQGIQNMLPRTDGRRVPELDRAIFLQGSDAIGNDAIRRPIAAADDVAGPHRSRAQSLSCREIRISVTGENEFRGGFGGAVGVSSA